MASRERIHELSWAGRIATLLVVITPVTLLGSACAEMVYCVD
jgi:hypothetical protein